MEEADFLLGGMQIYIDMVSWEPQILVNQRQLISLPAKDAEEAQRHT